MDDHVKSPMKIFAKYENDEQTMIYVRQSHTIILYRLATSASSLVIYQRNAGGERLAGYPKIWTRIRHRPWFRKLRAVQKCIWYESIMIAKEQTDDGWVCFPNISTMAAEIGCDRGSIEDWLWRECGYDVTIPRGKRDWNVIATGDERETNGRRTGEQRVSNVEKGRLVLRFYLVEYNDSQQVTSQKELKKRSLIRGKGRKGKERELEYIDGLKALKIDKSIFEELKKEIPGIDHDDELRKADLWRLDNPPKSKKPNDHLFLRNWFQRAKRGKDEKGKSDLSKYDNL